MALVITPYYASSLTTAANASQVESAIGIAISQVQAQIATPGNVSIVFGASNSSNYLGQSQTSYVTGSYSGYVSLLQADAAANPTNAVLATALANLAPATAAYGNKDVLISTAAARLALGATVTPCYDSTGLLVPGCNQTYDGVVTLSTSYPMNYGTTPVAGQYSQIATVTHEIDEILGIGGPGTVLNNYNTLIPNAGGLTYGQVYVGPLDLYRCSGGALSLTTATNTSSYFSVDGCQTQIISFNQTGSGDYGDWGTHTNIQSAASSPGNSGTLTATSPEVTALQAIGYTATTAPATPAPEPASIALLAGGLLGLGSLRHRRGG